MNDFDWDALSPDESVLHHQPRTAVYENPNGMVVIRQDGDFLFAEDQIVIVAPGNLSALIEALSRHSPAVQTDGHGDRSSRALTAAERKRLQRERERHSVTKPVTPAVTCRDLSKILEAPVAPVGSDLFDNRRKVSAPG
ncbi:MAG: hypothetical protein JNK84_14090 [Phreatobacter sp.]|uniref:hypothetical protein n=1 Tax=Phreatobacter sp. TaxID=1966341 RepID=UPI001A4871F3|nr:hypothetical protein [Phreatobacter sp.]MBL8570196.1 hypothetical protein [Phreatobacter sp.]